MLIVAGMLAAGVSAVGWLYVQTHRDHGTPPGAEALPAKCDAIGQDTLQRMRVTNPIASSSSHVESPDASATSCNWGQTEGRDGDGRRSLNVWIRTYREERLAEQELVAFEQSGSSVEKTGEGAITVGKGGSSFTTVSYAVRSGGRYVRIDYSGWDAGLLSAKQPDVEEWKKLVSQAAAQVFAKS